MDIKTLNKSIVWPNLNAIGYFRLPVWIDLSKTSGQWNTATLDDEDLIDQGFMETGGKLLSVPSGATQFTLELLAPSGGIDYTFIDGAYTLSWTGTGTFTVSGQGVSGVTNGTNSVAFTIDTSAGNGKVNLALAVSSLSLSGSDILDPPYFTVIKDSLQTLYDAGQRFLPEFIAEYSPFGGLRFMDWMGINGGHAEDWADRSLREHQFYRSVAFTDVVYATFAGPAYNPGVPIEVQFDACEATDCQAYFNIPARASDDWLTGFFSYLLSSGRWQRVSFLEWGNEWWNFGFTNINWARRGAIVEWGTGYTEGDPVGDMTAYGLTDNDPHNWIGKRLTEIVTLGRSILGGKMPKMVVGCGTNQSVYVPQTLEAPTWLANDPANYIAPHTMVDALAVAPYYGNSEIADNAGALNTALNTSEATFVAELTTLLDAAVTSKVSSVVDYVQLAATYGLDLHSYEGFQNHVDASQGQGTALYDGNEPRADFLDALYAFYGSAENAALQQRMLQECHDAGMKILCPFYYIGRWSKFGGWGMKEDYNTATPGSLACLAFNSNTPRDFIL
ncbi:MAG: hypothetical protein ACPG4X_16435 [Pikeienuella sp.]